MSDFFSSDGEEIDPDELPEPIRGLFKIAKHQNNIADKAQMESEIIQHSFNDWIHRMTVDELKILQSLINVISGSPQATAFYMGYIGGILEEKFQHCTTCGANHDSALEHIVNGE